MSTKNFFLAARPNSKLKTEIVVKYFREWAAVMARQQRAKAKPFLLYIDLFSGPGLYEDGEKSTPIQILEHAVANEDLRRTLIARFNDVDPAYASDLTQHISKIPNIDKLENAPSVRCGAVDDNFVNMISSKNMYPSFSFVDPFGYKGLSLDLVDALARGWGSDMVLFFSFDGINRALEIDFVKSHIDKLFGTEQAEILRASVAGATPIEREQLLVENFIGAIRTRGYKFVVPYFFQYEGKDRTSHYLIFISKKRLGFWIMKHVMYAVSNDRIQGVAKFGNVRSLTKEKTPLLALMERPLDDFAAAICREYSGQTYKRKDLMEMYDEDYPTNLLVDKNWRDALTTLEQQGRITVDKPYLERRLNRGERSFGPDRVVTFLQQGR